MNGASLSLNWSIVGCEKPVTALGSLVPAMTGGKIYHTFLALVDETGPESPVVVDEVHFWPTAKDREFSYTDPVSYISNVLNITASAVSLGKTFRAAAKGCGLGGHLFYLKASGRPPNKNRRLADMDRASYFEGDCKTMLNQWAGVYASADALNQEDNLFVAPNIRRGIFKPVLALNCRSGLKAVVERRGSAFKHAVDPQYTARGGLTPLSAMAPDLDKLARAENAALPKYLAAIADVNKEDPASVARALESMHSTLEASHWS